MYRRDFLETIVSGLVVAFFSQFKPILKLVEAVEGNGFIDIGALVKDIKIELEISGLKSQGWYAKGVDNHSDKAVIIIPEVHPLRSEGYYNSVFQVISKYVKSFGLEGAEYGSEKPLESIVEIYNQILPNGRKISIQNMLDSDKLAAELIKPNLNLFGLEDRDLKIQSLCLDSLIHELRRFKEQRVSIDSFDYEYAEFLSNCVKFEGAVPFKREIFADKSRLDDYFYNLVQLYDKYAVDESSRKAVDNIIKKLSENEKNPISPNIVGILYGGVHIPLLRELLSHLGISHVTVSNDEVDYIVKVLGKKSI